MSSLKVLGSADPVVTGERKETSDRNVKVIEVEGLYSMLENEPPNAYCPSGYVVESSNVASTGDGMGKMTIRCVSYNEGASFNAERTTFRVDMQEVQYDLEDHPHLATARGIILKWLATDEKKRVSGNTYKYEDADGTLKDVNDQLANKFCAAYMSGIKTFNRYYPVIEKISVYKNPPGLSMNGKSYTGGNPPFSSEVGRYNAPPINLQGFQSGNFFKSKDSWVQNADTTWTRTEQWTYTPESSSGNNAWIYTNLS